MKRLVVLACVAASAAAGSLPAGATTRQPAGSSPAYRLYVQNGSGFDAYTYSATFDAKTFATSDGDLQGTAFSEAANGRLAIASPGTQGPACGDVVFADRSAKTVGTLADSADYVNGKALALSADDKSLAFVSGPIPPADSDDADSGDCADHATGIELAPVAGGAGTTLSATGFGLDDQLAIAGNDRTVAVGVSRPHGTHAIVVVDTGHAAALKAGKLLSAKGCGLYSPSYLPSGTLVAERRCGSKVALVRLDGRGSATALATVPHGVGEVEAAPDGRVLVDSGSFLYLLAANQKGGLHKLGLDYSALCREGSGPGLCNATFFAW